MTESATHAGLTPEMLDEALTAQLAVAWAGERGEDEPRLGWWRTDLVSEFGGEDLFQQLLPATWRWATLQAAREAARRADATLRRRDADKDRIVSLFRFGFELDERIEERLADLKRAHEDPVAALPGLAEVLRPEWDRDRFAAWLSGFGSVRIGPSSVGRRIEGAPPDDLGERVKRLLAALRPLADAYPLPHFRRRD
jgi:hypothetical protein